MNKKNPTALIILDGWGYGTDNPHNAITQAQPPTFNFLWQQYPHALLRCSGAAVGLPEGTPGNSEVGHLTIGAGAVIDQPITIINQSIKDGSFFNNEKLRDVFTACKNKNGRLHLLGLLSDGCVHSNIEHLFALLRAAHQQQIPHVFVHAFLDGRDVTPRSAEHYLEQLSTQLKNYGGTLGSISGRFYAMDRDENWERTYPVFDMLVGNTLVSFDTIPSGITQDERNKNTPLVVSGRRSAAKEDVSNHTSTTNSWHTILKNNYDQNITDEFIEPILLAPDAHISDNDTLIFFNIRPDRMRQLVSLFLEVTLPSKKNQPNPSPKKAARNLTIASMVRYHSLFKNQIFFEKKEIHSTLLDLLEQHHKTVFTIAETEKYAHVTYFFSGGKETQRSNETRVLIPSHPERSYDHYPQMSAKEITDAVVNSVTTQPCDFYLINYANADMVGHSGDLPSTIVAVQCIDQQLKTLYKEFVLERNGTLYITADHGKAEEMWDTRHNAPKTAHTVNPVPFIMVRKDLEKKEMKLPLKELRDIASFILKHG